MKHLSILVTLAAAIYVLSGCADFSTPSSTASSSSSEGVAGEKAGGGPEERVGAGMNGMTPSAQVKW